MDEGERLGWLVGPNKQRDWLQAKKDGGPKLNSAKMRTTMEGKKIQSYNYVH